MSRLIRRPAFAVPSFPMQRLARTALLGGLTACGLAGCAGPAPGTLTVRVTGEEAATNGLASSQLHDGWAIDFSSVQVSLSNFTFQGGQTETTLSPTPQNVIVELTGGDVPLFSTDAPADRYSVNFDAAEPAADATVLGTPVPNVSDLDGAAIRFVGRGSHPMHDAVDFDLLIPLDVQAKDCTNGTDGTAGVVVPPGGTGIATLTVHLEHMVFHKLGTHRGVEQRFEALAAAAGDDGLLTMEDLEDTAVATLQGLDGTPLKDADGAPIVYDPGSSGAADMGAFVTRAMRDAFHLNGGGLCTMQDRS